MNIKQYILVIWCKVIIAKSFQKCMFYEEEENTHECYYLYSSIDNCQLTDNEICKKNFTATVIEMQPFKLVSDQYLNLMLHKCCGGCYDLKKTMLYKNHSHFLNSLKNNLSSSDFIYPVVGRNNAKIVKGYYFIPIIEITSVSLVTKKKSKEVVLYEMAISTLQLWPLVLICMFLSFYAGFTIWLLDTWYNKEEFPRSFLQGIYEGFWWAFVSMTTVGYGDRTPRSFFARMFGIVWILFGITICSMFTAIMTTVITNAVSLPSIDLSGKKIAVLDNRIVDAYITVAKGGTLSRHKLENIQKQFEDNDMYGFVIDRISATYFRITTSLLTQDEYVFQTIDYTSGYSYGILMKHEEDYEYFKHILEVNNILYETCTFEMLNQSKFHHEDQVSLFNSLPGLFWSSLIVNCGSVAAILLFGAVFETIKRMKRKESSETNIPDVKC